jgi:ABC-type phosphate/phosphonate transport system substrate-binding protein
MTTAEAVPIRIAALPMYDIPELRDAHDRLWTALAQRLRANGVTPVPGRLTRDLGHREIWAHPGLLFGQACEYPVSKYLRERLRIISTPRYNAPGCIAYSYSSAIVVHADEPVSLLEDLRQRRCVVNEPDSNSGMNLFRAALAPVAGGARFFRSVSFSGSHRKSIELIAAREADVTAVDCVTLRHLQRFHTHLTSQVKVIDWTPSSPCLPFVTSTQTEEATFQALRSAMADVFTDSTLAPARELLLLEGVNLNPDTTLSRVSELEAQAKRWRYPVLL